MRCDQLAVRLVKSAAVPAVVMIAALGATAPVMAQPPCGGAELSLARSFLTAGNPAVGAVQHPANVWTYRHTDAVSGPLLTGGVNGGSPLGAWITEGQPFMIPTVGGVYSPDPFINQMTAAFNRSPSFTGVLAHPGYPGLPLYITWKAQTALAISTFGGNIEVLSPGGPSDGVRMTIFMFSGGGGGTILGPMTVLPTQAGNTPFDILPIVPFQMAAGDRMVVEVTCLGQPFEDWVNFDLRLAILGAPAILKQPESVSQCNGRDARFSIVLSDTPPVTTFRWRRNGQPLNNGTTANGTVVAGAQTPTLQLSNLALLDGGDYDCVFDGPCGGFPSAAATLTVRRCPCSLADVTSLGGGPLSDGFLTVDDIIAFLNGFFAGDLAVADVAGLGGTHGPDGMLTADDIVVFLAVFFEGCVG